MKRVFIIGFILHVQNLGAQTLEFSMSARVKEVNSTEFIMKKTGETFELGKDQAYFVVPENQIPFLVLNLNNNQQKIKISANDFSQTLGHFIDSKVQDSVNEITSEIKKIEILLKKKDLSGAQGRISSLKLKYPQVSQILFLSASVNYLSQNSVMAIEELKRGLAIDPQDETALQLLKKIEGQKE